MLGGGACPRPLTPPPLSAQLRLPLSRRGVTHRFAALPSVKWGSGAPLHPWNRSPESAPERESQKV